MQLALRKQLDPASRNCDPAQPDAPDCYNLDYRCLARSVQCNESLLSTGVKTGCTERPSNFLEPLQKYYKFFSTLRSPDKLLISGIWTLPSVTSGGRLEIAQGNVASPSTATLNRAGGMLASCSYTADQTIFGQAQYRLSKFASLFGVNAMTSKPNALELSICEIGNYPAALKSIADALIDRVQPGCLPVVPKTLNGKPICLVGDVDSNTPNAAPDVGFPVCSDTCCNAFATSKTPTPADPVIQNACSGESVDPCYCTVKSTVGQCSAKAGVVAGVWRKNANSAPPGKQANFLCVGGG